MLLLGWCFGPLETNYGGVEVTLLQPRDLVQCQHHDPEHFVPQWSHTGCSYCLLALLPLTLRLACLCQIYIYSTYSIVGYISTNLIHYLQDMSRHQTTSVHCEIILSWRIKKSFSMCSLISAGLACQFWTSPSSHTPTLSASYLSPAFNNLPVMVLTLFSFKFNFRGAGLGKHQINVSTASSSAKLHVNDLGQLRVHVPYERSPTLIFWGRRRSLQCCGAFFFFKCFIHQCCFLFPLDFITVSQSNIHSAFPQWAVNIDPHANTMHSRPLALCVSHKHQGWTTSPRFCLNSTILHIQYFTKGFQGRDLQIAQFSCD